MAMGARTRLSSELRRRVVHPLALLAVTWAAACGGDGGTDPEPGPAPNRPPVASGSIPAQTMTVGESVSVNVASLFNDPDGDALTYTAISSAPPTASVALSGSTATVTAVGAGTATVTVTALDPGGLSAAVGGNVTVVEPNRPPAAVLPVAPPQTAVVGDTIRLDVSPFFSDPDGDALTYSANSSNTSVATVSVTGSVVSGAAVGVGSTTLTVTATDPEGLEGSIAVPVTVEPNRPPEATVDSLPLQTIEERDSVTVRASSYFTDPNGDALTYTAESSDPRVATVSVSGASVTITAVAIGPATVTVTASDPDGLTASLSGSVTVIERANRAPESVGQVRPATLTVGNSGTLELEGDRPLFEDSDGDALTYSAESSDLSVASVSVTGSVLRVTGEAVGTVVVTVTATDPGGLSASLSFDVTVLPEAGAIFRDDFGDDGSLDNWELADAEAEFSDGVMRLTNAESDRWGIAGYEPDTPVASWETRVRMGRAETDSTRAAIVLVPADPGELEIAVVRFEIGHRVIEFSDGTQDTVNYALSAFFTPVDRDRGWYTFDDPYRGISDGINSAAGEFNDITVSVQDGIFQALAGTDTLFSAPVGETIFAGPLSEIGQVHLWTLDPGTSNPSLFDWIEVNGVPTESSSANADGEDAIRLIPADFTRDGDAAREASAVVVDKPPLQLCRIPNCR